MPKIICGVTNCYLNKDKCCCANSIDVKGEDAKSRGATCCETFGNRQSGFSNSVQEPSSDSEISCSAEKCIHNEDHICKSQTIQIHGSDVSRSGETFCTTFHCE